METFGKSVIVTLGGNLDDDIDVEGGAYRYSGGVVQEQAQHRAAYEHNLIAQIPQRRDGQDHPAPAWA